MNDPPRILAEIAPRRVTSIEARIDGKWAPIFSSRHRRYVDGAFAVYSRICPWKVRIHVRSEQARPVDGRQGHPEPADAHGR